MHTGALRGGKDRPHSPLRCRALRDLDKATKPDSKELDLIPTLSSIICSFIHSPDIWAHIFVFGNEFALGNINSNSSCVEIKQLCDCFFLHFPWERPGLVLCCNVPRFYFVFPQSLFCGRGERGELPVEQGYQLSPSYTGLGL